MSKYRRQDSKHRGRWLILEASCRKSAGWGIAALLAALAVFAPSSADYPSAEPASTFQTPVFTAVISGNEELQSSPLVTSGTGTESDPFIIEDLDAREPGASSFSPAGIGVIFAIANTTAHVVVSHGIFYSLPFVAPWIPPQEGHVLLWNCTNAVFQNCQIYSENPCTFLVVQKCSHITLSGNQLTNSKIIVENSSDVEIRRNSIFYRSPGIDVRSSSNIRISENYIQHTDLAVSLQNSTGVVVRENKMVDNEVNFFDDNTEGANTYNEHSFPGWTSTKTLWLSLVLAVEGAMALVAVRISRNIRVPDTPDPPESPEEERVWW